MVFLEHDWIIFPEILEMSSSQLTNKYFSEGVKPPISISAVLQRRKQEKGKGARLYTVALELRLMTGTQNNDLEFAPEFRTMDLWCEKGVGSRPLLPQELLRND